MTSDIQQAVLEKRARAFAYAEKKAAQFEWIAQAGGNGRIDSSEARFIFRMFTLFADELRHEFHVPGDEGKSS